MVDAGVLLLASGNCLVWSVIMPNSGDSSKTKVDTAIGSKSMSVAEMTAMAKKLRRHIVTMVGKAGSGHPGGSLSAVEILASLYFHVLRHNPPNPQWPDRDRFIF